MVDALRGLAALAVVFFHLGLRVGWKNWGNMGVPVFFVLSGYVIAMSIGTRTVNPGYIFRFALRRELRLAPPYWLSILAVFVIGLITVRIGFAPKPVGLEQAWWHLFYLQAWLDFPHIQAVYWTLCYEIQFYMALLLLLWAARAYRLPLTFMSATLLLSLAFRGFAPDEHAFMGNAWFCFALGVLANWAVNRGHDRVFLALAGMVMLYGALRPDAFAITSSATAVLLYLVIASGRSDLGSSPVLQFLGRISYSLYLTHLVFGWVVLGVARHFLPDAAALLLGVAASIGSAWVFYVLIEAPSVRLSRRLALWKANTTPAPA